MAKKFIQKTWNGLLTEFNSSSVWTDGDNIYYSSKTSQYVLDKSTSTWSTKTWNGLTSFGGSGIWTDGENIYFSNGTSQYILNKSTSTWSTKTWYGLTDFYAQNIWTDGENIYYSTSEGGTYNYVLDKSTSTWSTKTWTGLTSFTGRYIWTDGKNIYYSSGSDQYVLNKSTSTWSTETWDGLTSFDGNKIWTDGTNIYYSDGANQYVYEEEQIMPTTYLSKLTLPVNVEGTVTNVEFTLKDAEARQLIEDLGHALYWVGITTTALTDGATTNPIVVNSEDVTVHVGAVASYDGLEFAWNGSAWQAFGHANFGALAFKSSASGSYTPAGSVSLSESTAATTDSVVGVASNGSTPYFTVSGETATFNPGAMPTLAAEKTFITAEQVLSASFSGTAATITVE